MSDAEFKHLGGEGVVVRVQYGNQVVTRALQLGTIASELWQDVAFTNGPPLVKITLEWAPEEYAKLAASAPTGQGE